MSTIGITVVCVSTIHIAVSVPCCTITNAVVGMITNNMVRTIVVLFFRSAVVWLTVVLRKFDVRGLMGGLIVVGGVEGPTVAVVSVVSMSAIGITVAIDA